ncbi:slipin family protein [Ktedonospora formicarum]|uniref:Membrane protein n=1 Tax=Ktedonospora formicarum TaxID=2778364 RepID=A0A8J3MS06_9CHLR|nr:slipin family protein [Ktedonospora formicarum]GHO42845.1 membrane protein [Ktedonospora formicarum]
MEALYGFGAFVLFVVLIVFIILLFSSIRIVQEYERGVVFTLGKLVGARGPGVIFIAPIISRMIKVDLRIVTLNVPAQEVITRDNITIKVTAVVYFYVVNPEAAVVRVLNFIQATTQIGQTTLRNVLGQSDLDDLLAHRNKINQELQSIIDEHTEGWGVKVTAVEIKDIELPSSMQRAMAKQAEAEREKRAKIIHASGELQASAQLAQAAEVIGSQPSALQLRYLQTLTEIAVEKNSTIIFPLPMDLIEPLLQTVRPDRANGQKNVDVPRYTPSAPAAPRPAPAPAPRPVPPQQPGRPPQE